MVEQVMERKGTREIDGWIDSIQAGEILGLYHRTVLSNARGRGWEFRREGGCGMNPRKLFRLSDVLAFKRARENGSAAVLHVEAERTSTIRALVSWADKLETWPTVEEIESRIFGAYRQKDIESVLDSRIWRKKTALRDAFGVKKGEKWRPKSRWNDREEAE